MKRIPFSWLLKTALGLGQMLLGACGDEKLPEPRTESPPGPRGEGEKGAGNSRNLPPVRPPDAPPVPRIETPSQESKATREASIRLRAAIRSSAGAPGLLRENRLSLDEFSVGLGATNPGILREPCFDRTLRRMGSEPASAKLLADAGLAVRYDPDGTMNVTLSRESVIAFSYAACDAPEVRVKLNSPSLVFVGSNFKGLSINATASAPNGAGGDVRIVTFGPDIPKIMARGRQGENGKDAECPAEYAQCSDPNVVSAFPNSQSSIIREEATQEGLETPTARSATGRPWVDLLGIETTAPPANETRTNGSGCNEDFQLIGQARAGFEGFVSVARTRVTPRWAPGSDLDGKPGAAFRPGGGGQGANGGYVHLETFVDASLPRDSLPDTAGGEGGPAGRGGLIAAGAGVHARQEAIPVFERVSKGSAVAFWDATYTFSPLSRSMPAAHCLPMTAKKEVIERRIARTFPNETATSSPPVGVEIGKAELAGGRDGDTPARPQGMEGKAGAPGAFTRTTIAKLDDFLANIPAEIALPESVMVKLIEQAK